MNRIRWYGPTTALLLTVLGVMILGPGIVSRLEFFRTDSTIRLARQENSESPTLAALNAAFRNVAKVVKPSVVHIQVFRKPHLDARDEELLKRFLPRDPPDKDKEPGDDDKGPAKPPGRGPGAEDMDMPQPYGNGSGWLFDTRGHVITNYHVIEGADRIIIRLHDGTERKAMVVGADEKTDIAVVKIEADNLHAASLCEDPVQQGDIVFAFGSPFRFDFSMSQGIVSGMGRELGILKGRRGYENFIQTDASINPGNSGGPLCDINGNVVGMNTAIATRSGGNQGIGFAIPIDMVHYVVESIITQGKVHRGYLGVFIDDLDPRMAKTFNFTGQGVLVQSPIEGSPGRKAGIEAGDIITHINGKPVDSAQGLRRTIAREKPSTKVKVELFRAGKTLQLDLVVGEAPEQVGDAPIPKPAPARLTKTAKEKLLHNLGIEEAETFTPDTAQKTGIPFTAGVLVVRVRPNSPAGTGAAELGRGHVVTHVMDTPVKTLAEFIDALAGHDLRAGVRLRTMVTGLPRYVLLQQPD